MKTAVSIRKRFTIKTTVAAQNACHPLAALPPLMLRGLPLVLPSAAALYSVMNGLGLPDIGGGLPLMTGTWNGLALVGPTGNIPFRVDSTRSRLTLSSLCASLGLMVPASNFTDLLTSDLGPLSSQLAIDKIKPGVRSTAITLLGNRLSPLDDRSSFALNGSLNSSPGTITGQSKTLDSHYWTWSEPTPIAPTANDSILQITTGLQVEVPRMDLSQYLALWGGRDAQFVAELATTYFIDVDDTLISSVLSQTGKVYAVVQAAMDPPAESFSIALGVSQALGIALINAMNQYRFIAVALNPTGSGVLENTTTQPLNLRDESGAMFPGLVSAREDTVLRVAMQQVDDFSVPAIPTF